MLQRKKVILFIIFLSVFVLLTDVSVAEVSVADVAASDASVMEVTKEIESVLIVCRQYNEFAFIEELVKACGKNVVKILEADYEAYCMEGINYVVTTSEIPLLDAANKKIPLIGMGGNFAEVLNGWKEYENVLIQYDCDGYTENKKVEKSVFVMDGKSDTKFGQITINDKKKFPFAVIQDGFYYIPFYKEEGLSAVLAGDVFQDCFNNKDSGNMYFMIDEVYPFSKLDVLCYYADRLYEQAIPFLVRIMPVYENLDYPSIKRYMQVLRYIQEKNATIVIHEPIVREGESEREPLEDKMNRFLNKLKEEKIYYKDFTYAPYLFQWNDLKNITSKQKNFGVFSFDSMLKIDMETTEQEFTTLMEQISPKWMSFGDYKEKFTTEKYQYKIDKIDDKDFAYREKEEVKYERFFSASDRILLGIVCISVLILTILLMIGRRWYRKKFYK